MKLLCLIVTSIACSLFSVQAQSYDEELTKLSSSLGNSLEKAGLKTVAIGGFKDLQGKETGLGKLLVEDISVDLVNQNKGVTVVDRANLSRLMEEYKLTEEGLVKDPDKTRQLKLAGIDAIILGTIVPFEQAYRISAKAIATDNAKVVAATRGSIAQTEGLNTLMGLAKLSPEAGESPSSDAADKPSGTPSPSRESNLESVTVKLKSLEFFKKAGTARITFSVKSNRDRGWDQFAYHLIDKNAPQDEFASFGKTARRQKGYKPEYRLVGNATDDRGQSYKALLPADALSEPKLPAQAEVVFAVEFQLVADPGTTIQIPSALTFGLEFFSGSSYGLRQKSGLSKWSVASVPIDKVY